MMRRVARDWVGRLGRESGVSQAAPSHPLERFAAGMPRQGGTVLDNPTRQQLDDRVVA